MVKNGYESPNIWFVLLEREDIITSSPDVGVDGGSQDGWWETNN